MPRIDSANLGQLSALKVSLMASRMVLRGDTQSLWPRYGSGVCSDHHRVDTVVSMLKRSSMALDS